MRSGGLDLQFELITITIQLEIICHRYLAYATYRVLSVIYSVNVGQSQASFHKRIGMYRWLIT